jgi:HAD superfamily 5'-nucleotidase-like hydrolase
MQFASRTLSLGQRPPSSLLRGAWSCSDTTLATTTPASLARARALRGAVAASASSLPPPSARARGASGGKAHASSSSSPSSAAASAAVDDEHQNKQQQHKQQQQPSAQATSSNGSNGIGASSSSSSSSSSAAATAPPSGWGLYGSLPPPPATIPAWDAARFGSGAAPSLDPRRRIYCNRSLNMRGVRAVGFDLDYTLASYRPETFEALAHAQTVAKLVECFGYPPEILSTFDFEWRYMTRGLIMDKRRGNVLKADRHKYVKVAYHGFRQLTGDQRSATYNASPVRAEFEEPHYGVVDTLFSLAEAYLFMQLVELVDRDPLALANANPEAAAAGKHAPGGYSALYRDVRAAVDLCHRDGSLKREVAADPARYIHADPHLVPMLRMLRQSGRKVFLATNSLWDYTNVVMNYLVGQEQAGGGGGHGDGEVEWALSTAAEGAATTAEEDDEDEDEEEEDEEQALAAVGSSHGGDSARRRQGESHNGAAAAAAAEEQTTTERKTKKRRRKRKIKRTTDWLRLFDVVVVGCAKPGFFSERRPLFAVNPRDGTLRNTDNGAPITPIGEDEDPSGATAERSASAGAAAVAAAARRAGTPADHHPAEEEAPVFQGGNYTDLHRLLGVKSGAEVLYVGDHIYGDILRSKKTLGWRTMLVAPELEAELARLRETSETQRELRLLREARAELDDRVQRLEWALKNGERLLLSWPSSQGQGSTTTTTSSSSSSSGSGNANSSAAAAASERAGLAALADLRAQRAAVKAQHAALLKAHHESFHPVWGQLLKTGYQNSRFAHQVDRFACLYGAHAANLAFYSPEASHRAKCDALAHEQWGGELAGFFGEGGADADDEGEGHGQEHEGGGGWERGGSSTAPRW